MAGDAVADIKARLDIAEVIGGYVRLQRSGRSLKGLCPFHSERTPSFNVSQERQVWHCFGCDQGGDVFTFVERIERVDFRQALALLAERAGVELEGRGDGGERRGGGRRRALQLELTKVAQAYYEYVLWSTPVGAPGRALLDERGVAEELARCFGVGFAPAGGARGDALTQYLVQRGHGRVEDVVAAGLAHPPDRSGARDRFRHRLVFPIRDERGRTLGFGGRALGDARPKYLNTPATDVFDKSTALFGIDLAREAIARDGGAVVVEGYFDVIAAHAAAVTRAVASSGTALTLQQVRLLARHGRRVVLCFDGDDAGRAAMRKAVELLASEQLEGRVALLPEGVKDPDELVQRDPEAFSALVEAAPREWQVLLDEALVRADGGGSVEERRGAAERAVALLARIPEATARALYAEQAARRLGVDPAAVAADVVRALAGRRAAPARVVVALPDGGGGGTGGAADEASTAPAAEASGPPSAAEEYLAAVALQRPEAVAEALRASALRLDELRHPVARRLVEVAVALRAGEAFPIHRLSVHEQGPASRLLLRHLPELGDPAGTSDQLQRALGDCVWRIREAGVVAEMELVKHRRQLARDEGHASEAEELAVRLHGLTTELHRARARRSTFVAAG